MSARGDYSWRKSSSTRMTALATMNTGPRPLGIVRGNATMLRIATTSPTVTQPGLR
jgi:hypothetical protein